ncbi:Leucine Rich Repeat [Seminavis robusta]|uniref:Leucine Rich Repeat n=1 Tax=Seminavis robusta TaxID=568900 RepID=A0A9N8E7D8_9STRA|nr:Leucine Rich Repeat [Seminavis robusta]|eukprot:Sro574_g169250.1 Leucine Rich Repeat (797) ;mRNA; f:49353-51974
MQEEDLDPLKLVELRQRALSVLAQSVDVDEVNDAYDQGVDVDEIADACDEGVDVDELELSNTAPATSGDPEASENEVGSNRRKEEAPQQSTATSSASINVATVERQESNFDVLKVAEARARAANMELSRVQHIDASDPANNPEKISPAGSPRQTTITQNETTFDLLKGVQAPFCDTQQRGRLTFFRHNMQTLDGQQPRVINPTMAEAVQAVNQTVSPGAYAGVSVQSARPGAYAGAPGASLHRNNTMRFSILGREGFFESASMTSFQSENFEADPTNETNSNRMSVAIPVDEPSTTNLQTAQELQTISESGQGSDDARIKRRKENFKATLKIAVPGLLLILVIVLLLVFLLPDKDQVDATKYPTTAQSMNPTPATTSVESFLLSLLPENTTKALEDTSSAQYQAFQWLLEDPFVFGYPKQRILQRYALMTVFYATAGPTQWFNKTGWGSYYLHECAWFQNQEFALKSFIGKLYPGFLSGFLEPLPDIQCDNQGRYQHLWLDQNNLVGSLPKELYSLTSLETFSAGLNPLVGSISSYIGQLQQLRGLAIFSTGLSGSIPKEMGSISSFEVIGLNDNKLEGSIPDELWQLSNLDSLVLGRNEKLRGTIPSSVGAFPKLRWLVLDDCDLSGNLLQGTLPSQLGLLKTSHILLRHNFFTGTLPSELGLTPLQWLGIESNQLSGAIPSAFSSLSNFEHFSLGDNSFTGEIPSEFGLLTSLKRLSMENNHLRGTVPAELASLQKSLYSFRIDGNPQLSGVIPEPLCMVNGTCISDSLGSHCEGYSGTSFDCTELLCGCDCPC